MRFIICSQVQPLGNASSLTCFKYLGNELRIPIVGVGIVEAIRAIASDPQLANRFEPLVLRRWEMDQEFLMLLASFERLLPLRRRSELTESSVAVRLLAMCGGTIGELALGGDRMRYPRGPRKDRSWPAEGTALDRAGRPRSVCGEARLMLWPARPQPFRDESLSSWFLRLARANGLCQRELRRTLCPDLSFSLPDLDTRADPVLFELLAKHTGLSEAAVRAMVLPVGTVMDPMRSEMVQRFCPACLRAEPYYRRSWLRSYCLLCPEHLVWLVDQCHACSSCIDLTELPFDCPLSTCGHCGHDLGFAAELPEDSKERTAFKIRQVRFAQMLPD